MRIIRNLEVLPVIGKKVLLLFRRHPAVLVPFLAVAFFDLLILAVLFLAPRPPFSAVIAPVIRAFWGERFLHYPANFLILPQVFSYARNAASFFIGVTFTGIAAALITQAYQDGEPRFWDGIKKAGRRYARLAGVWGIVFICVIGATKALNHFAYPLLSAKLLFGLDFLASIIVQMLFVFAIPAIIIENRKTALSVVRSLALFKNYPLATFALVLIPSLLFVPVTYLHAKLPALMESIAPEIVLYALVVRTGAIAVIDFLVTSSATVLLLMHREQENRGAV